MKAKIVLCDDEGNVPSDSSSTAHSFELGGQTLNKIEQGVIEGSTLLAKYSAMI